MYSLLWRSVLVCFGAQYVGELLTFPRTILFCGSSEQSQRFHNFSTSVPCAARQYERSWEGDRWGVKFLKDGRSLAWLAVTREHTVKTWPWELRREVLTPRLCEYFAVEFVFSISLIGEFIQCCQQRDCNANCLITSCILLSQMRSPHHHADYESSGSLAKQTQITSPWSHMSEPIPFPPYHKEWWYLVWLKWHFNSGYKCHKLTLQQLAIRAIYCLSKYWLFVLSKRCV